MTTDPEPWTADPAVRDDDALRGVLEVLASGAARPVPADLAHAQRQAVLAEAVGRPTRRRGRHRVRDVLALTSVKVVLAGGVAAAGTTTGLATTGTLPAPVQQWAHTVGASVGVGLPAAPGQRARTDGDPDSTGRDHAPGQLTRDDPDRNGRDAAPGRVGRDTDDPGAVPPEQAPDPAEGDGAVEGPGRSGEAPGRSGAVPGRP